MNSLLSKIKQGTLNLPPRILLSGPQGIGKTSWASHAPSPLFIAAEEGLTGFEHLPRFSPESATEMMDFLNELLTAGTAYKYLVFDTIDWIERVFHSHLCKRDNYKDIEAYGGGWGKGDKVASYELVSLLALLESIRERHKIGIIFLSHVQVKTFTPPGGDPYDRYQPKGGKQFTGVLSEWVDASLFCVYEVFTTEDKKKKTTKAVGGERIIHTQWSPAWDAKNRYNLPETIPLEWEAFERAVTENTVPGLAAKVRSLYSVARIPETEKPKWEKAMSGLDTMTADRLQSAITKLESYK